MLMRFKKLVRVVKGKKILSLSLGISLAIVFITGTYVYKSNQDEVIYEPYAICGGTLQKCIENGKLNDVETSYKNPTFQTENIQNTYTNQAEEGETCHEESIPYKTVTQYSAYLAKGSQHSSGGENGNTYYCVDKYGSKRIIATLPPYDKTIVVGTDETTYTPPPEPTDPNYGKVPSMTEMNNTFAAIAPPGQKKTEKIVACQQLFQSRGVSDANFQGYHVCSDYGLSSYSAY